MSGAYPVVAADRAAEHAALECARTPRRAFEAYLHWTLGDERAALEEALGDADQRAYFDYYGGLPAAGQARAVRRYLRGMWNGETGWVARWIAAARRRGADPVRVLDAGCGFGTFAMLYAAIGAEVLGVDLRDDRVRVAARRRELYDAHHAPALPVRFVKADLTRDLAVLFDVVWAYNAISHIDPIEPFLGLMAKRIRPGGILVIGDINGANPAQVRRLDVVRAEVHGRYVDDLGVAHGYAVERTFTPRELRGALRAAGFRVERHELQFGGQGYWPRFLARPLHALQAHAGPAARWARRQFVVATPIG